MAKPRFDFSNLDDIPDTLVPWDAPPPLAPPTTLWGKPSVPFVDVAAMQATAIAQAKDVDASTVKPTYWQKPSGLLGDIAGFIYSAAHYPSQEVAIAASIAFMAGICGRAYNTSTATGLNQYIALLAESAQGKEGAASGISKLVHAVRPHVALINEFIGPSDIASAQGLLRKLSTVPCFYSHKGELGFWLQKLNSRRAQSNETTLKGMILDLFNKSGNSDVLQGSIYADTTKNVPSISSPALTILGDSTPESFYAALDEKNISEGLVSRFIVITVPLVQPDYNPNAASIQPSKELVDAVSALATKALQHNQNNQPAVTVPETADAREFQLAYQKQCMDKVWKNRDIPITQIWTRAHIRLLRLGALIAVGKHIYAPCTTVDDYKWAAQLIDVSNTALIKRFESGEVGEQLNYWNDQMKCVGGLFNRYLAGVFKATRSNEEMIAQRVLTLSDIQMATKNHACFRNDRNPQFALTNVIKFMSDAGVILECSELEVKKWNKIGKCYRVIQTYEVHGKVAG